MKIKFFTNLDLVCGDAFPIEPAEMPAAPVVGDKVQLPFSGIFLVVVSRKWVCTNNKESSYDLEVELHDNPANARSIREFEEFYRRRIQERNTSYEQKN